MRRALFLILALMCSTAFAQQSENSEQKEKPKSYLFDEFGKISRDEIKLRTQKLRKKLEETSSKNEGLEAFLIFYSDSDEKSLRKIQTFIKDILYDSCRDCYGLHGGFITFINGGKSDKLKIQFWLSPRGAEPPKP